MGMIILTMAIFLVLLMAWDMVQSYLNLKKYKKMYEEEVQVEKQPSWKDDLDSEREYLQSFIQYRDDVYWEDSQCVDNDDIIEMWLEKRKDITFTKF